MTARRMKYGDWVWVPYLREYWSFIEVLHDGWPSDEIQCCRFPGEWDELKRFSVDEVEVVCHCDDPALFVGDGI